MRIHNKHADELTRKAVAKTISTEEEAELAKMMKDTSSVFAKKYLALMSKLLESPKI